MSKRELLVSEIKTVSLLSKKLKEAEYYRIRIGDFRMVYSIHDNIKIVKILSIAQSIFEKWR